MGQYDSGKLVNIGTHRWSFKPELGISKAVGQWTLEFQAAATFFTDNDDFYGGKTRSQDPLYSLQGHLITVSLGDLGFGRWHVLRRRPHDRRWRAEQRPAAELALGATLALPVDRLNSIKFYASSGVSARTGNNYDLVGVAWQYRWGGGL